MTSVKTLRTMEIEPDRSQPRKDFDEDSIASLAESIRQFGIIQPVIVKKINNGSYRIVAGERRWRAAMLAGIEEIPVIISDCSEKQSRQISLIENIQRENLNPIEEALGYRELADRYNMTQENIAAVSGRSRPVVANLLRMLSMPDEIQQLIKDGKISTAQAKLLLSCDDKQIMKELAFKCAEEGLTVKQLERLVKQSLKAPKSTKRTDSYFKEMEISLKDMLCRNVSIKSDSKGKGTLILEFYDRDDLSAIAEKLTQAEK